MVQIKFIRMGPMREKSSEFETRDQKYTIKIN